MKKLLALSLIVFALLSCEKEEDPDAADKFVGKYSYTMIATGGMTFENSGTFTAEKEDANRISIVLEGSKTYYTVNGTSITEETEMVDLPVEGGGTAQFTENSTGSISGDNITINGTLERTGYQVISFKIIASKI